MKVTYVSHTGTLRAVYKDVSYYEVKGEMLTLVKYIPTPPAPDIIPVSYSNFGTYETMAILRLAPGEHLEWSKDEES